MTMKTYNLWRLFFTLLVARIHAEIVWDKETLSRALDRPALLRMLAVGDFDAFNEAFQQAAIKLPDASVSRSGLNLDLRNMVCTAIQVGDLQFTHSATDSELVATIDLNPFSFICKADYSYRFTIFRGSARLEAMAHRNQVKADLALTSPTTFAQDPPSSATPTELRNCQSSLDIYNIRFSGGIVAQILNVAEGLLRDVIEREVRNVLCEEMAAITTVIDQFLDEIQKERLDPFLQPIPPSLADPLTVERNFATEKSLFDFQKTNETMGSLFDTALTEVDRIWSQPIRDETTGRVDLGFNHMLRNNWLDNKGALVLDLNDLSGFNPLLFKGHDRMTETSITMQSVRIYGLDSLKQFDAVNILGSYTVQTELQWDYLRFEVDLLVSIKPSTREDSFLVNPRADEAEHAISVSFGVDHLDLVVAIMVAMDQQALGDIALSSILDSGNIFNCLLSILVDWEISGMKVKMQGLHDPVLAGFVSPGVDRVITDAVKAGLVMYESTLLRAAPHAFQSRVRELVNTDMLKKILRPAPSCKVVPWPETTVDLRDLLLEPAQARSLGGTGSKPYGDLSYRAYQTLLDRFLPESGDDDLAALNEMLIRPMTKRQSGEAGIIQFQSPLFKLNIDNITNSVLAGVIDRFALEISQFQVTNVDTIASGPTLLAPTRQGTVLHNAFRLGREINVLRNNTSRNLGLSTLVRMNIDGLPPFNMSNEIALSMAVTSLSVDLDLKALFDAALVSRFQLRHILKMECWIAAMMPELATEVIKRLVIESLEVMIRSLRLHGECRRCSGQGTIILPDVLNLLRLKKVDEVFQSRLPHLMVSLTRSEWVQSMIDRRLGEAASKCPGRAVEVQPIAETPKGPLLVDSDLDTLLYSGFLAVWVGFLIFANNARHQEVSPSDPFSDQHQSVMPEGGTMLDWLNLGESTGLGPLADEALQQLRTFLAEKDEGGSLKVNRFVEGFLDVNQSLSISANTAVFELDDLQFSLHSLKLKGLNSFQRLDLLVPIASQTLENNIHVKNISVEMQMLVKHGKQHTQAKNVTFAVDFEDLKVALTVFASFDLSRIRQLPLAQLLRVGNVLPCFLSTAHAVKVPRVTLSFAAIKNLNVIGLLDETNDSISEILSSSLDQFEQVLVEGIPRMLEGGFRQVVSDYVGVIVAGSVCPKAVSSSQPKYIDFRDLLLTGSHSIDLGGSGTSPYGDFVPKAVAMLRKLVTTADEGQGTFNLNEKIIRPWTKRQSGVEGRIFFEGNLFDRGAKLDAGGLDAQVRLRFQDVFVENLDTLGSPLSLLEPVNGEAHHINNTARIAVGRRVRLGSRFLIELQGSDSSIRNDIILAVSFQSATVVLTALAKVMTSAFMQLPLEAVADVNCWLALLPPPELDSKGIRRPDAESTISVLKLGIAVASLALEVSCIECNGPKMMDLTALLSEESAIEDSTKIANRLLRYATDLVEGDYFQDSLDRLVVDSRRKCPYSPEYDKGMERPVYVPLQSPSRVDSMEHLLTLVVIVASLVACLLIVWLTVKVIVTRRHAKWISSLQPDTLATLTAVEMQKATRLREIDDVSQSLFLSKEIPYIVRYGMPLIILGNIAFFLSGHLSLGGSVTIVLNLAGESFVSDDFFEFSMAASAIEIWNAGGKGLAMMILIFSGIWPYTKQLVTLFLWFSSTRIVSTSRRGTILVWLDSLAKWSMIDIFVLVMTLTAFRVSIQSPDVAFLPTKFYSIDLLVVPMWGLYANMIAQLISQVSSHFIIHFHRKAVLSAKTSIGEIQQVRTSNTVVWEDPGDYESDEQPNPDHEMLANADGNTALCNHPFRRSHRGEMDSLVPRPIVKHILIVAASLFFALVVAGCIVPSYVQEVLGVAGILVESGQRFAEAEFDFSVFDTVRMLYSQAQFTGKVSDYIGLGTLSTILLLSVLFVPLAQCAVLLGTWFVNMSLRRRQRMMVVLEILGAWQYIEVFLLSVVVAAWQLGPVSEHMINAYCGSLTGLFAQLAYYGIMKPEDAQCFRVNTTVGKGFFILAAACVILAFMNSFVSKAAKQFISDREDSQDGHARKVVLSETEEVEIKTSRRKLLTVPVLFSDSFRWLLQRRYPSIEEENL